MGRDKNIGNPDTYWKPNGREPYDPSPVCVKVLPGVREQLKSISDWQNKLRSAIDQIIATGEGG